MITKVRVVAIIVLSVLVLTAYGYVNNPVINQRHDSVSGTELVVHTVVSVWKLIDNM